MDNNLLTYRNVIISESTNSDLFSEIKPYPTLNWSVTPETTFNQFIVISFTNDEFITLTNKITVQKTGTFSEMQLYYSIDGLSYILFEDYNVVDNDLILTNDIVCKKIKFVFTGVVTISINKIELYETLSKPDYTNLFKKYKLAELKTPPEIIKDNNLGKLFTEYMSVLIDE